MKSIAPCHLEYFTGQDLPDLVTAETKKQGLWEFPGLAEESLP